MSPEFKTHRLSEGGMRRAVEIAEEFDRLLVDIEALVGPSADQRQMALCRTLLEEACFRAKKSMAMQPEFQEPKP